MERYLRDSVHFRATSKSGRSREIRIGMNNRDTAIVPTLELQGLFGWDRRCMVSALVAKPNDDDKEPKE